MISKDGEVIERPSEPENDVELAIHYLWAAKGGHLSARGIIAMIDRAFEALVDSPQRSDEAKRRLIDSGLTVRDDFL